MTGEVYAFRKDELVSEVTNIWIQRAIPDGLVDNPIGRELKTLLHQEGGIPCSFKARQRISRNLASTYELHVKTGDFAGATFRIDLQDDGGMSGDVSALAYVMGFPAGTF